MTASADAEQQAKSDLDTWAAQDIGTITVSDDSWGARLSTKWVGMTDPDGGHPAPYTATEIKSEFDALRGEHPDLKVLKSNAVGDQTGDIDGKDGWIAVVVNSSITSQDDAQQWCKDNFDNDEHSCGVQHLDAAHHSN